MHIGKKNSRHAYIMNSHKLEQVDSEKDLGVFISDDMKTAKQCGQAYARANKMLGLLKRTIKYRDEDVMLRMYKALVRPHVEYCTPVWSPHCIRDRQLIEKVQHRFTKLIPRVRDRSYEERIAALGL